MKLLPAIIILAAIISLSMGGLKNQGKECWWKCKKRSGYCGWCGTEGMCCKRGSTGGGCTGRIGWNSGHKCVDGRRLLNSGRACYSKCGKQSGLCNYCGTQGLCCRQNFEEKGCDGWNGAALGHVCVSSLRHVE